MKQSFLPAFVLLLLLPATQLLHSCANIIPPSGGPKDSLPPVLVSAVPRDSALHFNSDKIVITFDEYVTLDNAQQNLIVSPVPKNAPQVSGKLRTITVKLRDSLEANTTYSINFGHAIKDVNEGNVAKQLTYVFSTGSYIDSNYLEGRVLVAQTGKVDTTLIAVLHQNLNDTAIYKNTPRYYARIDGSGNFRFAHLPAETFSLFIIPDDYSKKYDDSTKLFAFADSNITVSTHTPSVTMYAYQEYKEGPKTKSTTTNSGNNNPNKKKDKDKEKEEDKRLKITGTSLAGGEQDLLGNLQISFNRPLRNFDSTAFVLTDTGYKPLAKQPSVSWSDTTATKLTLRYSWQVGTQLKLIIKDKAVTDSADMNLYRTDTLPFVTKKEAAYGSIKLHFEKIDYAKNPVLLITQNDKTVDSVFIKQKEWFRRLFNPGDYELKILYDTNADSVWTPGQYWLSTTRRQPELIVPATPAKISVRANWDNEWDVSPGDPFEAHGPDGKRKAGAGMGAGKGGGIGSGKLPGKSL
ncbi:Ig-like domain-containing protein [Filimonas lacunae]|nr:Ig-like domain-containing protein [Filimonas lacunae]